MSQRSRFRPSPALVVSIIALVVALGGTGYAASTLPKNSVSSGQIKRGAVHNSDLARGAVTSSTVRDGSLLSKDFKPGQLPAGPAGPQGPTGTVDTANFFTKSQTDDRYLQGSGRVLAGRLITALNPTGSPVVLDVPGIVTVRELNCQAGGANVTFSNPSFGTTDVWYNNDTGYSGTNWAAVNSPFAVTGTQTLHIGKGSGPGATILAITVSTQATGSDCRFQAFANLLTGS
jgi:hypothetical protein